MIKIVEKTESRIYSVDERLHNKAGKLWNGRLVKQRCKLVLHLLIQ